MNRNFLKNPGDAMTITISGPSGVGKSNMAASLSQLFRREGMSVTPVRDDTEVVINVSYPSEMEYLQTLSIEQRETLRGHLDALGYSL